MRRLRIAAVIGGLLLVNLLVVYFTFVWSITRGGSTRIPRAAMPEYATPDALQVVTVQMRWDLDAFASPERFAREIDRLAAEGMRGVDPGAPVLLAYPELVGAPLYLLGDYAAARGETTFEDAMTAVAMRNLPRVLYCARRFDVSPTRAICLSKAARAGRVYVETFSRVARDHRAYVVAGSMPLPEFAVSDDGGRVTYRIRSGDVHNVAYVFGPDGRVLGRQKKVKLTVLELAEGLDMVPGALEELEALDTPFGRMAVAICWDAFHEDVVQRLLALGATVLVQPSANYGKWNEAQQVDWLRGAHAVAQEHPQLRCVVNPMMTGNLFDLLFEGQSGVAAHGERSRPGLGYALAPVESGFLSVARSAEDEEVLVTRVP